MSLLDKPHEFNEYVKFIYEEIEAVEEQLSQIVTPVVNTSFETIEA